VAAARTEYEKCATKRVTGQRLPAERRKTIDALSEIYGLDGHEDPHLRSDLDHER
jgi:hypothetical protein